MGTRPAAIRRNTKIVATYGPAIATDTALADVLTAGADAIRVNCSHGTRAEHDQALARVRRVAEQAGRPTAVMLDLRGPKIRLGELPPEGRALAEGAGVLLRAGEGSPAVGLADDALPVQGYPALHEEVRPGEVVLLADGALRLRVDEVVPRGLRCTVEIGGTVTARQGVNFPDSDLRGLTALTVKDEEDLRWGLAAGVDWIALSFVRRGEDVAQLRERIAAHGEPVPVIAKIEKREALDNLDAIVDASDGVMVARGDLGVETELEEVTLRQKEIIRACNRRGKVVITATQMLESMIHQPTPTRAEVADISNAIFDGTDALMLSGETAVGAHPVAAVRFMASIAERTEEVLDAERMLARRPFLDDVPDAVAHAACVTAHQIAAHAMICLTRSGLTARRVSRYRPRCPVIAVSPEEPTMRRLALVWGVEAIHLDQDQSGEALIAGALEAAREAGLVRAGQRLVITAGVSPGVLRGQTNLVRVEVL